VATKSDSGNVFEFDGFAVFEGSRQLRRSDGEQIALTPKVFDTLLYLVENPNRLIEKDELMQAVWADTVVEENNLNKNISTLRRLLGEKQGENRYIATIPGRGYKFVSVVRVSDRSDLLGNHTAAGEASAIGGYGSAPIRPQPTQRNGRWRAATLLAIGPGLLVILSAAYFWNTSSRESPLRTIAVLPFKPMAAGNRDEILEMGMADTLIARLSDDSEMVVRSLGSVRRYGGLEQDPITAGRELGVESVLDGSLQRVGDQIRVNVRLVRTTDGASLMSETFDEKFTDIFSVQDRIARKAALAMKTRLGAASANRNTTESVEAYRLYLQGRYHALKSTPADIRQGIEFYRRAIEADPNYALAFAGMAQAYAALPITSDVPPSDAFPQSKAAAVRALEIDPDLAEARIILGTIEFWYEWRWAEAETELKRAITTDPNNPDAHRFYGVLLTVTGRSSESLVQMEKARELDPLSLIVNALKSQAYFFAGRDAEAIDQAKKTLEIEPNFWIAHLMMARAFIRQNNFDEAVASARRAEQFSGGNSEAISLAAYALAKSGRRDEALSELEKLKSRAAERYVPAYNLAMIHNGLGRRDEAIQLLEDARQSRDARMILLKVDPKWDELRYDARFIDLMRRTNFE
jgi:DNA-binding winged helix-turn-helix (wHTH) protein/TolB-like protein/Flp pilus assembly protein TadD